MATQPQTLASQLRAIAESRIQSDKDAIEDIKKEARDLANQGKFELPWYEYPSAWLYNVLVRDMGFEVELNKKDGECTIKW
jgi:hypothetical protein